MSHENPFGEDSQESAVNPTAQGQQNEGTEQQEFIDATALNNRIVRIEDPRLKAEAIAALSGEEIAAVADKLLENSTAAYDPFNSVYGMLGTFNFDERILAQPETVEAIKNVYIFGDVHLYNIDRLVGIPVVGEAILADEGVHAAVVKSVNTFFTRADREEAEIGLQMVDKLNIPSAELREIAENIKGNHDSYGAFFEHFGQRVLYPELG
jgi:hypothetical protein